MSLTLGIVAGEPSGDRLGGELLRALRARTEVRAIGIGGPDMASQGLNSLTPLQSLSMHGFAEPLRRLPFLWKTLKQVEEQVLDERADVFVGVDFNVFNLLLEGRLKRRGVSVVHYVSPSVYAWRQGRTRRIARSADVLLTLFPFEPPLYAKERLRAVFVGHPLADQIDPDEVYGESRDGARSQARRAFGLAEQDTALTLMPGSRMSELKSMLPSFLDAATLVMQARPDATFLLPCATAAIEAAVRELLNSPDYAHLKVSLIREQARLALTASDAALIKSGTSTLEAMLLGVPMVVAYRLPRLTYEVVSRMLRTPHIALPNILAAESLVPELLQDDMQPKALADELLLQLEPESRARTQARFAEIHSQLRCGASDNAANEVLALLNRKSTAMQAE